LRTPQELAGVELRAAADVRKTEFETLGEREREREREREGERGRERERESGRGVSERGEQTRLWGPAADEVTT